MLLERRKFVGVKDARQRPIEISRKELNSSSVLEAELVHALFQQKVDFVNINKVVSAVLAKAHVPFDATRKTGADATYKLSLPMKLLENPKPQKVKEFDGSTTGKNGLSVTLVSVKGNLGQEPCTKRAAPSKVLTMTSART